MLTLRPYQIDAVRASEEAYSRGVRGQAMQLPTGSGKTVIFSEIIRTRPKPALILAHRDELISQARDKLRMVAPELAAGIVKAERNEQGYPVTIASIQTLARESRLARMPRDFATVIADECHHVSSPSWRRVLDHVRGPDTLLLGVSATLERSDKHRLDDIFDEIVYELNLHDMISGREAGYLCPPRAIQVKIDVNFGRVKRRHGDYAEGALETALHDANAPGHAVTAYEEHAAGRKALLFAPTVASAKEFAAAFAQAGYASAAVWGDMPRDERHDTLRRFSSGEIQVLGSCMVLTEGYDEPSMDCLIMARPTQSRPLYVQMLGRGLRPSPGKENCIVLDLVGSAGRHDLMTAATLFGVDPKRLAEMDLDEAERFEAGLKSEMEQAVQLAGELVSREVDLFRRRDLYWTRGGDFYTLSAGDKGLLVVRREEAGYTVARRFRAALQGELYPRSYEEVLAEGLDIGYAQGYAEDYVRREGARALNRPGARWRSDPPTDNQIALLKRRGRAIPATKGEASDLISQIHASGKAVRINS